MSRLPCPSCPWRIDQDARDIPNFRIELAEGLSVSCPSEEGYGPDFGTPMFACHQSRTQEEIVCAGWLAAVGDAHPGARMSYPPADRRPGPGWPALHATFRQVIEKLRATANLPPREPRW